MLPEKPREGGKKKNQTSSKIWASKWSSHIFYTLASSFTLSSTYQEYTTHTDECDLYMLVY